MRKIVLLGYMGCGKSTIAEILAQNLHIEYIDLDQYIERKAGFSIAELFANRGEIHFRKIEHESLTELLSQPTDLVIALGGGTPCYANNHLLLNGPDVISIYLKASIGTLVERLSSELATRPLVANLKPDQLPDYIAKHLFDRSYFYHQATHTVSVDNKTPDDIVADVLSKLA